MSSTVGFVGLGHMGGPMAANLVKAGYRVLGFDLMPAALEQATTDGVTVVESSDAAAGTADVVITMLPSGKHVIDLYQGGLLAAAKPGTLFVDCSTIDVADAKAAADLAQQAGHRAVDAPVSGGVAGAAAGTLAFMVGGSTEDFDAAHPLLDVMGGQGRALRRQRRRAGREDLQQHGARHLDDRGQRGVRPRREAGAEPPGVLRRRLERLGAVLVADELLPGPRAGAHQPREQRLRARLRDRPDGQGPRPGGERAARQRRRRPARAARRGDLQPVPPGARRQGLLRYRHRHPATIRGRPSERIRNHSDRAQGAGRRRHPEPAEGAQRAEQPADGGGRRRGRGIRRRRRHRRDPAHRVGEGFRGGCRHQGDAAEDLRAGVLREPLLAVGSVVVRAHPDRRGGLGLRARRRLRTGDAVRLHHRLRHRQVRSARDQARRHPRASAARSG